MTILYKALFLVSIILSLFFLFRVILFKTGLIFVTKKLWRQIEDCFHLHQFFKVPEFDDDTMQDNQLYRQVSVYLNSLSSIEDSDFTNLVTGKNSTDILLRLDSNQIISEEFLGAKVSWMNQVKGEGESSTFVLKLRKADKRRILRPYLQHIHTVAEELEDKANVQDLKLYTNADKYWRSVPFNHPSTFETIVMEPDLKQKLKSDLESFVKAKQYYNRLGRVWRRSYLLYGPSGTGKSSFVAAMANFLGYDVFNMDIWRVLDDSDLKLLLLRTRNKSVIVIEDLDRYLTEKKSTSTVSFSGILNFMDGILNCIAEERIMVFTMNSKDNIDPVLLRPGRIDVHIHFPLCNFSAFKTLASSYLGIKDHKLYPRVEETFQSGASLSTAEIGELMIANRNSPSRALKSVITALQTEGEGRGSNTKQRMLGTGSESGDHSGIFSKENVKDIKKLYGLLRLKSHKKSESFELSSPDHKMAS